MLTLYLFLLFPSVINMFGNDHDWLMCPQPYCELDYHETNRVCWNGKCNCPANFKMVGYFPDARCEHYNCMEKNQQSLCQSNDHNRVCQTDGCLCRNGYRESGSDMDGQMCTKIPTLNSKCGTGLPCDEYQECGDDGKCSCQIGYYPSRDSDKCLKTNNGCSTDSDCNGGRNVCGSDGLCLCVDPYYRSADNHCAHDLPNTGNSLGLAVGLPLGIGAILCALGTWYFWWRRRKTKRSGNGQHVNAHCQTSHCTSRLSPQNSQDQPRPLPRPFIVSNEYMTVMPSIRLTEQPPSYEAIIDANEQGDYINPIYESLRVSNVQPIVYENTPNGEPYYGTDPPSVTVDRIGARQPTKSEQLSMQL